MDGCYSLLTGISCNIKLYEAEIGNKLPLYISETLEIKDKVKSISVIKIGNGKKEPGVISDSSKLLYISQTFLAKT